MDGTTSCIDNGEPHGQNPTTKPVHSSVIQENEQLRQKNKHLSKENERLRGRIQELEARTKKTAPIAIGPHPLAIGVKNFFLIFYALL
ncbi:hypothetical protein EP10_001186 [Geobacillus icigianus]|uniref:Transposase n=1 Tax=Geobacillus icigianus TaxID=1430331 RepID=A0ABU6BEU0_9BACL|nr:hypothetical protein B4113_3911 [Geobacillus sp. B4113_201601]MEB3750347.1 hypothetical protein [Geobacillus icigianus]